MSFLDKLKVKVEENQNSSEGIKDVEIDRNSGFLQLDVDIFQTDLEIIIIAPIPGVEVSDLDISIENENDVVTIQGKRNIPKLEEESDEDVVARKYLRQECQWGQFFRQIILPQEVNVAEVEARFKKGILILTLPMLRLQTGGKKKIEIEKE